MRLCRDSLPLSDQQQTPGGLLPCSLDKSLPGFLPNSQSDLTHLFSQQTFIEHLSCAKHHQSPEDTNVSNNDSRHQVSMLPVFSPPIISKSLVMGLIVEPYFVKRGKKKQPEPLKS